MKLFFLLHIISEIISVIKFKIKNTLFKIAVILQLNQYYFGV